MRKPKVNFKTLLLIQLFSIYSFSQEDIIHYNSKQNKSTTISYSEKNFIKIDSIHKAYSGKLSNSITNYNPNEKRKPNSGFSKLKINSTYNELKYPIRTNVKLIVYASDRKKPHNASGVMISENFVLTAAHCLFNSKKVWIDSLIVIPAYKNSKAPFGKHTSKDFFIFKKYFENKTMGYDIGLIKLNSNIGEKIGYMGLGFKNNFDEIFRDNTFYNFSYPSKHPYNKNINFSGTRMYYKYGNFLGIRNNNNWLYYKGTSMKGESGSAFYDKNTNIVYGVLATTNSNYNLISQKKYIALKNIIDNH